MAYLVYISNDDTHPGHFIIKTIRFLENISC